MIYRMLVLFTCCWLINLSIQAKVGKLNGDLIQPSRIRYKVWSFSVIHLISIAYWEGLISRVKLYVVVPQAIGISLRNNISIEAESNYEVWSFSVIYLISIAYWEGLISGVKLSVVVPQAIGISLRNSMMMMMLLLIERSKCWRSFCWSKGQSAEDVDADRKVKRLLSLKIEDEDYMMLKSFQWFIDLLAQWCWWCPLSLSLSYCCCCWCCCRIPFSLRGSVELL